MLKANLGRRFRVVQHVCHLLLIKFPGARQAVVVSLPAHYARVLLLLSGEMVVLAVLLLVHVDVLGENFWSTLVTKTW